MTDLSEYATPPIIAADASSVSNPTHFPPHPSFWQPESKHADSQTAPPTRKRHSPSTTRTQNSYGHPSFFSVDHSTSGNRHTTLQMPF